jgi:hypothetical protein
MYLGIKRTAQRIKINRCRTGQYLNADNTRSFRYWPGQNAIGFDHANDIPLIRYADILLSRAEALNELNGPTQEALDLINEVRERAGIYDLQLADFASKDQLRDHILKKRGWEFYDEAKRREDPIRQNRFIEYAIVRSAVKAKPYHVLFPIPQQEIDANPLCDQNDGY